MPIKLGNIKIFSIPELSKNLRINISTLRKYIKDGKLKGQKLGNRYYVTEDNLKYFFNQGYEKITKISKKKLIQEIEKTGYPTELKVGNILTEDKWEVQYNRYYIDRDKQEGREIDITAFTSIGKSDKCTVGLHLVCEVKKSINKPWIVFSTEKEYIEGYTFLKLQYSNKNADKLLPIKMISSIDTISRIGRSYCQGFKSKYYNTNIFEALTSTMKASEYLIEKNKHPSPLAEALRKEFLYINFIDPIIVLDGLLYEAYLNQKNGLELKESGHIPVSFGYISPAYKRYDYLVDIVTLDELPNLLIKKRKWLENIKRSIYKEIDKNK